MLIFVSYCREIQYGMSMFWTQTRSWLATAREIAWRFLSDVGKRITSL